MDFLQLIIQLLHHLQIATTSLQTCNYKYAWHKTFSRKHILVYYKWLSVDVCFNHILKTVEVIMKLHKKDVLKSYLNWPKRHSNVQLI